MSCLFAERHDHDVDLHLARPCHPTHKELSTAEPFAFAPSLELVLLARAGMSLNSGDNRGDWLYASAVKYLGSWGAAVEVAGFDYDAITIRPYTADEVLAEIRRRADSGERVFATEATRLAATSGWSGRAITSSIHRCPSSQTDDSWKA